MVSDLKRKRKRNTIKRKLNHKHFLAVASFNSHLLYFASNFFMVANMHVFFFSPADPENIYS